MKRNQKPSDMNRMIQRSKRMLLALFMCVVALTGGAKERTVPEAEPVDSIVVGEYYIIYNTSTGRWLSYDNNRYVTTSSTSPATWSFWSKNGDSYYIKCASWNMYCLDYNGYLSGSEYHSIVTKVDGGFTFKYGSYQTWADGGSDNSRIIQSSENNVWQLYEPRNGLLLRFYNALEQADAQGYHVDKYDAIYEDENSTNSQLLDAAIELERAIEFSNTLTKASNNEYPLLFTRTGAWWKVRKDHSNYVGLDYEYNN